MKKPSSLLFLTCIAVWGTFSLNAEENNTKSQGTFQRIKKPLVSEEKAVQEENKEKKEEALTVQEPIRKETETVKTTSPSKFSKISKRLHIENEAETESHLEVVQNEPEPVYSLPPAEEVATESDSAETSEESQPCVPSRSRPRSIAARLKQCCKQI